MGGLSPPLIGSPGVKLRVTSALSKYFARLVGDVMLWSFIWLYRFFRDIFDRKLAFEEGLKNPQECSLDDFDPWDRPPLAVAPLQSFWGPV